MSSRRRIRRDEARPKAPLRGLDHRDAARRHAAHQAWQRFGMALALPDLREAERRIWSGDAEWLCDQPHANGHLRSAYEVKIKGRPLIAIFDLTLDAIVTVLPERDRERIVAGKKPPRRVWHHHDAQAAP